MRRASLIDEAALEALGLTAADITLTAVYHRISQSPSQNGKKNTVPVSNASILQSLLMSNALGNTLTFRASRTQGGVTYYQDYTVTIRRTLSLDALRVSYAGAAMKMTPDYAASVTQYAVTAPPQDFPKREFKPKPAAKPAAKKTGAAKAPAARKPRAAKPKAEQ